ncbi:uncharacterized protein LOC110860671 [Folsomia candida]|uniref:Uncharacterized protein n=1 Tax=Folsomia candida TaxID=158441 RepID=A0A226D6W0_FOLCA|nr:uncharacterized protein LOC110860671 [Folsomia candida]XP_035716376.1 uncharacterized protein LOC110860671 [Folsomia candida]XP_035716378.1 uncharacterized protein LOC110860671 [Folsomia candida]XP_035716379.1 uncharacterized protein LOC110860671 [Folsomia candida]XP_035716380.1 uncharacterized protein LOC110860671 [Folsomia candida]XP_035716381.1 uncharacterized protein LOC110860671 [Folsomia candida]OXA40598.1 hypothetical protein Fcan01_24662 [Folsomia candida]
MEMMLLLSGRLIFTMIFFFTAAGGESGHSSLVSSSLDASATAEARGGERCQLPGRWEGNWFQSGVHQTISINSSFINIKGKCLENDGDKFLFYNEKENCYRCTVFHEKDRNILQYKETFCIKDRRSLKNVCSTITGDANLFSLFRLNGQPIECPFKGPFTFTYNRGQGDCSYPVSTIESCIQPSRQLLNYESCPDVKGTESTVEELTCLGTWKEGSSRYLLGLIRYQHHASYEERFRCFVYEKSKKGGIFSSPTIQVVQGSLSNSSAAAALTSSTRVAPQGQGSGGSSDILFRVAQSGDATCNGLTPMDGSRTLILKKAPPLPKCQFPSWVQVHQWHTLDQRSTFNFDSSVLKVSNSSDAAGMGPSTLTMTAVCHHITDNPTLDRVVLALHVTSECQSGYMCTAIYRRDGHIVEMQMGSIARRPDDACHISSFNHGQLPYVTLVSSTPETRQCPNLGQFAVTGLVRDGREVKDQCGSEGFTTLRIGCSTLDTLQFRSGCSNADVIAGLFRAEYACHGWWEEMGVSYLITTPLSRASTGARRYCFVFRETLEPQQNRLTLTKPRTSGGGDDPSSGGGGGSDGEDSAPEFKRILHFSSIADSCRRNVAPGIEGALAFNVTSHGRCEDISSAISGLSYPHPCCVLFLSFVSLLLSSYLNLSSHQNTQSTKFPTRS